MGRGPHVSVAGFVFDGTGRMVLLHRSNEVRSAKNAWSFPSGLHEERLTLEAQLAAELNEELGLMSTGDFLEIGTYENIAICDGWHWVIVMFAARVRTLDSLVNREPEKHDDVALVHVNDFNPQKYVWAPKLGDFITRCWPKAHEAIVFNLAGIPFSAVLPSVKIDPVWAENKSRGP